MHSILHPHYDNTHRAMLMAERNEVMFYHLHLHLFYHSCYFIDLVEVMLCLTVYDMHLQVLEPLRLRSHSVHNTKDMKKGEFMHYDERYTEFIEMIGLLPFINMVTRSMPNMNPSAITALVDRWRPETHTFHLRVGEMTVTLQDVTMILALPIDGEPLVFDTYSVGWRSQMVSLIGVAPEEKTDKEEKKKDRVPAGATYVWIVNNFGKCPIEADRDTVQQYARVYIWYVISRTLFPDGGGRTASWVWLKVLTDLRRKTSWG